MLGAFLVVTLTAADVQIAIPNLSVSEVPPERVTVMVDYLAEAMSRGGGVKVTTPSDIAAVLGNERQRQLLGCTDDTSCLAEISGAVGADYLVIGSVARVGGEFIANLKLIVAKNAEVRGAWSARVKTETELLDFLEQTGSAVRAKLVGAPARPSFARWVPAIVGAAAVGVGVGLFAHAFSYRSRLVVGDDAIGSVEQARAVASTGRSFELAGLITGAVGLALCAGGVLFAVLTRSSEVTVGAAWVDGPAFALGGRLP